mgnify:FL=1
MFRAFIRSSLMKSAGHKTIKKGIQNIKTDNFDKKKGEELLAKQLRSDYLFIMIMGIPLLIIGCIFLLIFIMYFFYGGKFDYRIIILVFVFSFVTLFGLSLVYIGIRNSKIQHNFTIKKYPEIINLVEDLYTNTIFENHDVIVSNKALAPKLHLTGVIYRMDVYYIDIGEMSAVLKTKNRKIYFLYSNSKTECKKILKEYCPNANIRII